MMNNIEIAELYKPMLDEIYQQEAKTAILEGDSDSVIVSGYGEVKVAKLDMDGLGDFQRNSGYTKGTTKLTWETIKMEKERSEELRIDRLDESESLDMAFAKLGGEFMRTKVIPETDAARIAKLYGTAGVTTVEESLETGEAVIKALRKAANTLDDAEVPEGQRILFIDTTLHSLVDDLDTTKSKKVLEKFDYVIPMPSRRMYTKIVLNDGKTDYGYKKAADGHEGNFLVVEKSATIAKLAEWLKYIDPDNDQIADDHVFKYRNNNLYAYVYENKVAGVYGSYAPLSAE